MLRQSEIMHELAQMAFEASKGDFDELILELEINVSEGTVEEQCRQTADGKVESLSLWDVDPKGKVMDLCFELHDEMKHHTGGELTKATVTIDAEGTARASFEYGNEPTA